MNKNSKKEWILRCPVCKGKRSMLLNEKWVVCAYCKPGGMVDVRDLHGQYKKELLLLLLKENGIMEDYSHIQYTCRYCKETFDTIEDVFDHLKTCANNPVNRCCHTCGNRYNRDQDESARVFCKFSIEEYPNVWNCNVWNSEAEARLLDIIRTNAHAIQSVFQANPDIRPDLEELFRAFAEKVL